MVLNRLVYINYIVLAIDPFLGPKEKARAKEKEKAKAQKKAKAQAKDNPKANAKAKPKPHHSE